MKKTTEKSTKQPKLFYRYIKSKNKVKDKIQNIANEVISYVKKKKYVKL